jgi:DNA-binding protein HU-beta
MTHIQLTYLAEEIGNSKRRAKSTLDELNELVSRQIKKEGLSSAADPFAFFVSVSSKARVDRNPATGEQIRIPARARLGFTAAKESVLGTR